MCTNSLHLLNAGVFQCGWMLSREVEMLRYFLFYKNLPLLFLCSCLLADVHSVDGRGEGVPSRGPHLFQPPRLAPVYGQGHATRQTTAGDGRNGRLRPRLNSRLLNISVTTQQPLSTAAPLVVTCYVSATVQFTLMIHVYIKLHL